MALDIPASEQKNKTFNDNFEHIKNDIINSCFYLNLYRKIYEEKKLTIDLLNNTIPTFAEKLKKMMEDYLTLRISRLTDNKNQGNSKDKNISIFTLKNGFNLLSEVEQNKVDKKLKEIEEKRTPIREYRNKKIAHKDKQTIDDEKTFNIKIKDIKETLEIAYSCIQIFHPKIDENKAELADSKHILDISADQLINALEVSCFFKNLMKAPDTPPDIKQYLHKNIKNRRNKN